MRQHLSASLVLAVLVAACEPAPTTGPATVRSGGMSDAKASSSPQVLVTFADFVDVGTAGSPSIIGAGYRGDGRLRDGSAAAGTPSNEYQGQFCGVNANVGTGSGGQTTQFTFDPDQFWSSTMPASCQPSRAIHIHLDGLESPARASRQHRYFAGLGAMTPGQSFLQAWHDGTGAEFGVNLRFDGANPPASPLRWTRLADVVVGGQALRQWRIETQGTHRAMGFQKVCSGRKCSQQPTGITYYLPWAMTVTEVATPYPSFP